MSSSSYHRPLPTPPPSSPALNNNLDFNNNNQNNNNNFKSSSSSSTTGSNDRSLMQASSGSSTGENGVASSSSSNGGGGIEVIVCNGCKLGLEEASDAVVVSFGERLWHVDCRCAKCHNLVEHDTNLLLLSDGSPVCENCSYICSVCQAPISNEAIVTGDESYHADCFRCRSCTNKIEELIFAKTSQGIWCMACHNERVARSRKHAEAKRSRSSRKEKERNGSASLSSRRNTAENLEGEMMAPPPPPPPSSSSYGNNNGYDSNSRASSSLNYDSLPSTSTSLSTLASEPQLNHIASPRRQRAGLPVSPSQQPVYQLPSTAPSSPPPPPSHSPLMRSNSPLGRDHSSSGNNSNYQSSPSFQQQQQERQPTSPLHQFGFPSSPRLGSETRGDSDKGSSRPTTADPTLFPPPPRSPHLSYDSPSHSSSHLTPSTSMNSNASLANSNNSLSSAINSPPAGRSANLSAPIDEKSSSSNKNRRSGFYGLGGGGGSSGGSGDEGLSGGGMSGGEDNTTVTTGGRRSPLLGLGGLSPSLINDGFHSSPVETTRAVSPSLRDDSTPIPTPILEQQSSPQPTQSFLPELHTSISFYDPDTLLFLDHVGSVPSSPKGNASTINNRKRASSIIPPPATVMEELSLLELEEEAAAAALDGDDHGPDSDDEEGEGGTKSIVARKLRESIRKSRDAGEMMDEAARKTATENSMGVDVDLVEILLGELDGTKMEMKDLQGKYRAFRRASRSAFEGFSMAREEYDKEVIARKEAESKMDQLRIKLTEQALTLAAVDKEQKSNEALKRQSTDLRLSVVGMERQLSQLRAEVELSTAQVEELTSIDAEELEPTKDGSNIPTVNHLDIARSLSTRLENVKDEHRRQIESLIQQRDDLSRQVSELKVTRDNYTEDVATLNAKKLSLIDSNLEASRQLSSLQEAASRFRAVTPNHPDSTNSIPVHQQPQHQYTPSSSSSFLATTASSSSSNPNRSPLAPTRILPPPSSPADQHVLESVRRVKPEEQHSSVAKKFKWGKTKTEAVPRNQNNGNNNTNITGSPSGKTPPPSRSGVSSNHHGNDSMMPRTHVFQQTSILRPVRCEYCGDKMWGLNEVRCTTCGCYSHAKCAGYLQGSCNNHPGNHPHEEIIGANPNGLVMFGTALITQTRVEDRQVPIVVSKCIAAVETYGMNYEGIYRKTGGTGQVRLITQYFERGQEFDLEDLDKFNDLAAVTSCMKNFFRTLPDPLFTHELHEEFVSCVEQPEGELRLISLEIVLHKLPAAHFFTALALMSHLHRVHLRSSENKMTPANLGVVFGPTVLRSITPSREFSDMGFKAKIVELMVEHQPRLFSKPYQSI